MRFWGVVCGWKVSVGSGDSEDPLRLAALGTSPVGDGGGELVWLAALDSSRVGAPDSDGGGEFIWLAALGRSRVGAPFGDGGGEL